MPVEESDVTGYRTLGQETTEMMTQSTGPTKLRGQWGWATSSGAGGEQRLGSQAGFPERERRAMAVGVWWGGVWLRGQ